MTLVSKLLDKLFGLLKLSGAAALTALMLLTVVDVIGRYFKHPVSGSVELSGFLAVIVVAAALPYTYKLDGHVGVEILVRKLSKKNQLIIDFFTRLMTLILFALIAWQMVLYAKNTLESGEVSMILEFPVHTVIYLLAAALFAFCITILESIFHTIKQLRELSTK